MIMANGTPIITLLNMLWWGNFIAIAKRVKSVKVPKYRTKLFISIGKHWTRAQKTAERMNPKKNEVARRSNELKNMYLFIEFDDSKSLFLASSSLGMQNLPSRPLYDRFLTYIINIFIVSYLESGSIFKNTSTWWCQKAF